MSMVDSERCARGGSPSAARSFSWARWAAAPRSLRSHRTRAQIATVRASGSAISLSTANAPVWAAARGRNAVWTTAPHGAIVRAPRAVWTRPRSLTATWSGRSSETLMATGTATSSALSSRRAPRRWASSAPAATAPTATRVPTRGATFNPRPSPAQRPRSRSTSTATAKRMSNGPSRGRLATRAPRQRAGKAAWRRPAVCRALFYKPASHGATNARESPKARSRRVAEVLAGQGEALAAPALAGRLGSARRGGNLYRGVPHRPRDDMRHDAI